MRRTVRRMAIVLALSGLVACDRPRTTEADCQAILERIVALELRERGFSDPALVARKQAEMQRTLAGELHTCTGKRIRPKAMACVAEAASSEQISHRCLH